MTAIVAVMAQKERRHTKPLTKPPASVTPRPLSAVRANSSAKSSWTATLTSNASLGVSHATMSRRCTASLHNPAWSGYRLADMLHSTWFRHSSGGMHFHTKNFPGSLADIFLRHYGRDGRGYRAINRTHVIPPGLGYAPPVAALVHMLSADVRRRAKGVACVQVRAGDVLDRSPFSVEEMLARQTHFHWRCAGRSCTQAQDVPDRPYVPPLSHWQRVRDTVLARRLAHVVVVAGSHYKLADLPEPRFGKSCAYIERVGAFFRRANLSVSYRIGQPPDDDFRFMTHVTLLAPSSAASMYARLTSAVAAAMGVQVLPGPVGA